MNLLSRVSIVCLLLVLVNGCGFHLRGSMVLPTGWESIDVRGASPNGELQQGVLAGLRAAGIEITPDADITLHLGREEKSRRNIALDTTASATEYEVQLGTEVTISDAMGEYLLEPTLISVQRLMNHNPNDVVGEAEEVRTLERELRDDLVQQILRRLRFLASSHAAST